MMLKKHERAPDTSSQTPWNGELLSSCPIARIHNGSSPQCRELHDYLMRSQSRQLERAETQGWFEPEMPPRAKSEWDDAESRRKG
jgi:hypothetical protein